jgi:hypothetical protein
MSDQQQTEAAPAPGGQSTAPTPETGGEETTNAPPEVDWKAKAREWEKRAKANADAAKKLEELEESQKTEQQKLADRLAELEQEAAAARAEALRYKVASQFGVTEEDATLFLTGTDEETLTKQAERLVARSEDAAKPRPPQPDPNQGRSHSGSGSTADQFAAAIGGQL